VRCILIDYSKAPINHSVLFLKLLQLPLPSNILLWIFNFLTDRLQAVSSLDQLFTWLTVIQSIIQESGIGLCLYLIYASGLRTLSPQNVIIKYADNTTLLVAPRSYIDQAYNNVCSWSTQNKLSINTDKTKEIIVHRPAARHLIIPPPLPGIERVKRATLLALMQRTRSLLLLM